MKYPEIGGTYLHYKGGKYKVITLSIHTETKEVLVIYKSQHFGSVYARPLSMWFEDITMDDGTIIKRFEEIL
jgi:hypothetical protein